MSDDPEKEFLETLNEAPLAEAAEVEALVTEEAKTEESPPAKTIKFKVGEQEYEIPADARLADKDLDMPLEEIVRSPWAQKDIGKKYSELDQRQRELEKWGQLRDRLSAQGDKKGYDKVTDILTELARVNPSLIPDIEEFEKSYTAQVAEYLRSSEEQRRALDEKRRADALRRDNESLQRSVRKELTDYAMNQVNSLVKEYEIFGASPQQLDQLATKLIQDGYIEAPTDKRSVDNAMKVIGDMYKAEYGPKKERALQDLNSALDLVEEISPKLGKSDEAVLDAYNLLVQKKLPKEEAKRRIAVLYADTLPESGNIDKQRERVTGQIPSKQRKAPTKGSQEKKLVKDPEDDFRKSIFG